MGVRVGPGVLPATRHTIKLFMSAIGHRSAMGRQQAAAMCLWRLEACTMWQYVTTCALHYDWQEHMMCGN